MQANLNLQRHVQDELDWEPSLDASQIGVTAHEGVVTLTGHLPVYAQKHAAEEVAKRVHGVRAVANEIEVRPTDAHARDDEEIAAAAVHALEWDSHVPHLRIRVAVEDGWVTIDGTVEHQYQKVAAERTIRNLAGARGVRNAVQVAPVESGNTTQSDIEAALKRSALLREREIGTEVDGTKVILTGDVHSHRELEEAVRIGWSARGVQQVENCLTLTPWGSGPASEWGY